MVFVQAKRVCDLQAVAGGEQAKIGIGAYADVGRVVPLVRQAVGQRLIGKADRRAGPPRLGGGRKAKQFLDQLSAATTREQIDEATALSRAPVSRMKAMTARLRRSLRESAGMESSTWWSYSSVGTGRGRLALATRQSFSDRLK